MNHFTSKYAASISGVLSGFDRLVLRGNLRRLCFVEGMSAYLQFRKVLLKDFGQHADQITERIKQVSLSQVQKLGHPVRHLASSLVSKEEIARRIAREDAIKEGPVCVLTAVEPFQGFDIYRNRDLQRLLFTGEASSPEERKRRSAWVTRQLRLLRAHGLISKVPHTHRYSLPWQYDTHVRAPRHSAASQGVSRQAAELPPAVPALLPAHRGVGPHLGPGQYRSRAHLLTEVHKEAVPRGSTGALLRQQIGAKFQYALQG